MEQPEISCKCAFSFIKVNFFIATLLLSVGLTLFDTIAMPVKSCAQEAIELLEPKEGALIIAKKPVIKCRFSIPFLKESIYIGVDQTDMTALADIAPDGFSLTPFNVLPSGSHKILVTFLDESNAVHTREYEFTTRHSEVFEQVSSTNRVSFVYSQVIKKMDDAKTKQISDWELEGNLSSQSMMSEGPWEASFTTNARYTDQQLGVSDPIEKGLTLIDYMINGKYDAGEMELTAAIGDVSVEGTKNTIGSLSRKGGTFGAESSQLFFKGFALRSQQLFGISDVNDAVPDNSDHLLGLTGGAKVFDEKMDIKAIYVTGGEKTNAASYGIWPGSLGTKGDAFGVEVKTDFFDRKFTTLIEYDISDYDADISDSADGKSDKAYLGKIGGVFDFFNYSVLYEYTGPDYKVPTSSLQQDRKGVLATTGLVFGSQSLQFNYGQHNDNIDGRPTYARIDTREYGATYSLNAMDSLPVSMGWQRSLQDSSLEPIGTGEIENSTDTVFGSISYLKDAWMIGMQPEYSQMDDKTSVNYDTDSKSITVFSSYSKERFSISPSITFNRFRDHTTEIEQDTLNYNLSIFFNLYEGLDIEGSGSYGALDTSDHTVDQDSFNGDLQLSYQWQKPIYGIFSPKLLLRASHDHTSDKITDTSSKGTIIYLLFSGSFDLSF